MTTLFAGIDDDRPAIVMAGSGQTVSYGELRDASYRLAAWFERSGLRPGDHVAYCLENRPEFFVVAWAAFAAGLVYTPLSSRLTTAEATYIVQDCDARAFITSSTLPAMVEAGASVAHRLVLGEPAQGSAAWDQLASLPAEAPAADVAGQDMLYSSGTTGRPKGVFSPKPAGGADVVGRVAAMAAALYGCGPDTVYLSPAPLYHAAPMRFCLGVHTLGGTVVVMESFEPEAALAAIDAHGVTTSQWVPTMFVKLLKLPDEVRTRHDVSSMDVAIHAAAPCPVPVKQAMLRWWGPIIHEYYAGTEGNGSTTCTPEEWLAHPGTVGRPAGCTVHIVGDDGAELPVGEEGVVYFDGAAFEYHNDPGKTAESRHPSGWSTLGDIGRLDEDGYLYLTDRKSNMIITGGVNVYPQEVENLLVVHPKVGDVAVIGVPNEEFGEEVKAVVQPMPGVEPGDELERELLEHCRANLASVKCPRSIDFREELPRHPTGKLYKRLLRDEYWAGRGSRLV